MCIYRPACMVAAVGAFLALPALAMAQTTTTVVTTTTVLSTTTTTTTSQSGGGTASTLPPALQCQNRAATAHASLARRLLQCERMAERRRVRGRGFNIEACRHRAEQRFERRFPKRIQGQRCPQCVQGSRDLLRAAAEELVFAPSSTGCEEGDRARASKCMLAAVHRLSRLLGRLSECRVKAATKDFENESFDEVRCQRRMLRMYDKALDRLDGCPPCAGADVQAQLTRSPIDAMLRTLDDRVAHCSCLYGSGVCDDGNACTADVCDPLGNCAYAAANSQHECPDFDNDGNPCTTGICDSGGRCQVAAANDGNTCPDEDDNPCTTGVCRNMVCTPVATNEGGQCADDGNACTNDRCEAGLCAHPPVSDGTSCADGDLCNGDETCVAGTCRSGSEAVCLDDDFNPCTVATCDPVVGCVFVNRSGPCEDGNACTFGDVCVNGSCEGDPLDCDDRDACTVDTCSSFGGCVHTPILGCE